MEKPTRRPAGRTAFVAMLAVLVALVAAVSATAFGGADPATADPAASQGRFQPVQESERDGRSGPGGRDDCPEKDGRGGGTQPQDESATPDSSAPDPSQEL